MRSNVTSPLKSNYQVSQLTDNDVVLNKVISTFSQPMDIASDERTNKVSFIKAIDENKANVEVINDSNNSQLDPVNRSQFVNPISQLDLFNKTIPFDNKIQSLVNFKSIEEEQLEFIQNTNQSAMNSEIQQNLAKSFQSKNILINIQSPDKSSTKDKQLECPSTPSDLKGKVKQEQKIHSSYGLVKKSQLSIPNDNVNCNDQESVKGKINDSLEINMLQMKQSKDQASERKLANLQSKNILPKASQMEMTDSTAKKYPKGSVYEASIADQLNSKSQIHLYQVAVTNASSLKQKKKSQKESSEFQKIKASLQLIQNKKDYLQQLHDRKNFKNQDEIYKESIKIQTEIKFYEQNLIANVKQKFARIRGHNKAQSSPGVFVEELKVVKNLTKKILAPSIRINQCFEESKSLLENSNKFGKYLQTFKKLRRKSNGMNVKSQEYKQSNGPLNLMLKINNSGQNSPVMNTSMEKIKIQNESSIKHQNYEAVNKSIDSIFQQQDAQFLIKNQKQQQLEMQYKKRSEMINGKSLSYTARTQIIRNIDNFLKSQYDKSQQVFNKNSKERRKQMNDEMIKQLEYQIMIGKSKCDESEYSNNVLNPSVQIDYFKLKQIRKNNHTQNKSRVQKNSFNMNYTNQDVNNLIKFEDLNQSYLREQLYSQPNQQNVQQRFNIDMSSRQNENIQTIQKLTDFSQNATGTVISTDESQIISDRPQGHRNQRSQMKDNRLSGEQSQNIPFIDQYEQSFNQQNFIFSDRQQTYNVSKRNKNYQKRESFDENQSQVVQFLNKQAEKIIKQNGYHAFQLKQKMNTEIQNNGGIVHQLKELSREIQSLNSGRKKDRSESLRENNSSLETSRIHEYKKLTHLFPFSQKSKRSHFIQSITQDSQDQGQISNDNQINYENQKQYQSLQSKFNKSVIHNNNRTPQFQSMRKEIPHDYQHKNEFTNAQYNQERNQLPNINQPGKYKLKNQYHQKDKKKLVTKELADYRVNSEAINLNNKSIKRNAFSPNLEMMNGLRMNEFTYQRDSLYPGTADYNSNSFRPNRQKLRPIIHFDRNMV